MDETLTIIKQQIQNWIRDKATAEPDPTKIKAVDTAQLFDNLTEYMDGLNQQIGGPATPSGVFWYIPPLAPTITTNTVTETQSEVNDNGDIIVIPAQTITIPYAAAGKKRVDAIVATYTADPPFYARVAGAEVDILAIAPTPTLNPNDLFVRYVDVTDGVITQGVAGAVKSVSVNGGATQYPDATGKLDLEFEGGGGNVDTVNGQVPDGSKNVLIEAQHIDYSPADNNNTTGFFAGLLTSGKLKVKNALDQIVSKKADKALTIHYYSASHTLTLANSGGFVQLESVSALTLTVPPDSSVAFPTGTQIVGTQMGSGQVTVVAGSGVTVRAEGGKMKTIGQHSGFTLVKVSADTWNLFGGLTA